jgi:hypothetical protein
LTTAIDLWLVAQFLIVGGQPNDEGFYLPFGYKTAQQCYEDDAHCFAGKDEMGARKGIEWCIERGGPDNCPQEYLDKHALDDIKEDMRQPP